MSDFHEISQRAALWRADRQFSADVLGHRFQFSSTWGLFSPEKLDEGSLLLLDYIDFKHDDSSIDLGCGYGVLGMAAARVCPLGEHLLIDKDFVAVEYAQKNIAKNNITNARAMLSNGFGSVDGTFSLVMSNLPAKVSKEQHYLYLLDAYAHMQVGARFYVVTINGLRDFIKRAFGEVFGNAKKIKQGKTYTITMAIKE